MSSAEIEKKEGGFRPPKLRRRGDKEFEFSNLDLKLGSDFNAERELRKTFLERQIETVVLEWLSHYKFITETQKFFANEQRLKNAMRTLKSADRILLRLLPFLRSDPRVPSIKVEYVGLNRWTNYKATDFLHPPGEEGILVWIADWTKEIKPRRGRPPQTVLANCAEELATLFKERTGQSKWEQVGRIVAKAFEQYLPPDDGRRDHRLWIRKLVIRNRKRKQWIKMG